MSTILSDFLTRAELAAELGVCERTLIRWGNLGEGPAVTRIGHRPMYRRAAVEKWLATREVEA